MTQRPENKEARSPVRSLRISDELFDAVKQRAAETGDSLAEVVRQALVSYLGVDKNVRGVLGRRDREINTSEEQEKNP